MAVMDKYVERFREGMDDEFQLDVMYRAHVIFAGFSANVSLACAAVLSWILPPDYVLVSYIMGVPLFAGEIAASWYASKRVIRPRINVWGAIASLACVDHNMGNCLARGANAFSSFC